MMAGGIHDFEVLRMLLGEPSRVHAVRVRQRFPEMQGDDTSVATVQFPKGAVGILVESFITKTLTTAAGQEVHTLRVEGDLGSLCVDRQHHTIRLFSEHPAYRSAGLLSAHTLRVPVADPFEREIQHFIACVRQQAEPITSGRSQRRTLELVLAAYTSMASGEVVPVG